MAKELEGFEEGPKAEILIDLLRMKLKTYQIGKRQALMEYMDSGSRNSPPFMIDKHTKHVQNMYKIYELNRENHENLESGIDSKRESLAEAKIQRSIFQGDRLSSSIFITAMMPRNHIFRKCTAGYKLICRKT